jgi:prepilin-type N-terminal cleavage/methylation domain-containing protein/prepilin-type processing-associated H-X9-DG protein
MKTRAAFTLIELLVVIAIIAILAAILFPVFRNVSMQGKETASMNNMRQWGTALMTEVADNDYRIPFDGQISSGPDMANPDSWFNKLPPYIKEKPLNDPEYIKKPPRPGDKSIWINPAVPKSSASYIQPPKQFLFCYAENYFLATGTNQMQKMNPIERPAATVFMGEKGDNIANCNPKYIQAFFGEGDPLTAPNNSAHFLFCDGHVELRKRSNFDPALMPNTTTDPSPINTTNLNQHFTFIPYVGAVSQ